MSSPSSKLGELDSLLALAKGKGKPATEAAPAAKDAGTSLHRSFDALENMLRDALEDESETGRARALRIVDLILHHGFRLGILGGETHGKLVIYLPEKTYPDAQRDLQSE